MAMVEVVAIETGPEGIGEVSEDMSCASLGPRQDGVRGAWMTLLLVWGLFGLEPKNDPKNDPPPILEQKNAQASSGSSNVKAQTVVKKGQGRSTFSFDSKKGKLPGGAVGFGSSDPVGGGRDSMS